MKYIYITTSVIIFSDPDMDSKNIMTMRFFDLANNYDLQTELKLGCTAFLKPSVNYLMPKTGEKLYSSVAGFISAFKPTEEEQNELFSYLMTNPVIKVIKKTSTS
jgi:hypothetical protein